MSYTAQKIHNMAISIIDEVSENGTVDATKTKEYASRAPYLIDMWQKETVDNGALLNVVEYVNIDSTVIDKWTKLILPITLKSIKDAMFIDSDTQIKPIRYKQFGTTDIYLEFPDLGTARILYIPIPAEITTLSQTLEIDDITATSGAYYLAEHYALADQNNDLANTCKTKFRELKFASTVRTPMTSGNIEDVYRGGF